MEADFGFWRFRGRLQQRAEFLVDIAESAVVEKEDFINFSQALMISALAARSSRILMKARITYRLIATARGLLRRFAAIKAPCSVKA